jgi:hypothetical protein
MDELNGNTLEEVNRFQVNKYGGMVNFLNKALATVSKKRIFFEVVFKTIIVSSLGAIPNFTIRNLNSIIGGCSRSVMNLWAKRLVLAALKGSFLLWIKAAPEIYVLMQKTITMDEMEQEDEELGIIDKNDSCLRCNLSDVVTEELNGSDFIMAEEQPASVENLVNDCEEKEHSKELFVPEICNNDQSENEESIGMNLPDAYVQEDKIQVVETMSEFNTHGEDT